MKQQNIRCNLACLLAAALLLSACAPSNYSTAHNLYARGRYAAAIESYDHYLGISENGATATQAELERGEAYYQLGLRAMELERWKLAVRFLYLSNLPKADDELDRCYFVLAGQALERQDYDTAMQYYTLVVNYLPGSELIPQIHFERIRLQMDVYHNDEMAWGDYVALYDSYPDSPFMEQAQPYADRFLSVFIDQVLSMQYSVGYEPVIDQLKLLAQYPSSYRNDIYLDISEMYDKLAEQCVEQKDYIKAEQSFREVVNYNPARRESVDRRLREIAGLFIQRGNELLAQRQIDDAVQLYRKTFDIIPGYEPAVSAVMKAEMLRRNIAAADSLWGVALSAEQQKHYEEALRLYRQANVYDPLPRYADKIFLVTNLINIEQDPVGFAKSIVSQYKSGRILQRINQLVSRLVAQYGRDNVTSSPELQFMLSIGEAKYEVRYDITTPDDSYYLVWLVNLLDRSVTPLNKKSEELIQ